MHTRSWLVIHGLAVLVALALAWLSVNRWQHAAELRIAVARASADVEDLPRLQRENRELRARQLAPAERLALEADRAALPPLRAQRAALSAAADAKP